MRRKPPPSSGQRRPGRFGKRPFIRRKVCRFCADKIDIDYKLPNVLKSFTSDRGRILSRRFTGTCSKHQHKLTQAIKRARVLAMLPFTVAKN
jgi:small subunit ribosomal protein S18